MKNVMNLETLLKKVEDLKKGNPIDLSTEEDLALAIMNLISIEEHLFFTGAKTEKESYWDMLDEVRQMRKELLARMLTKTEGETWCISKHLLSATMRLIEVGTKLHADGKREESHEIYKKAHTTFSLFWALRLKLIELPENEKINDGKPMSLNDLMDKLVDCCKE